MWVLFIRQYYWVIIQFPQKIIMVKMVNTSLYYVSMPGSQVSGAFNRCYLFMQITIVSVEVNASTRITRA